MTMQDALGDMLFETVEPHIREVLQARAQRFERTLTAPDGTEATFEMRFIPDMDGGTQARGFVVLGTDVTESRRARLALEVANSKLVKESATDFLTGISNRRVFSERSEEAARRFKEAGETYGLILLDLDDFKLINDNHGHDVGDEVLRIVGRLLKSELRSHRDVAARLGGEEFAILCFGDLDAELLRLISERVRERMTKDSVQVGRGRLTFTASFGLALSQTADTGWKDIYARADRAMYQAKAAGKDQVKFSDASAPAATGRYPALRVATP
jgi:diguanylate cyclase (GGDEF)-like protein